MSDKLKTDKIIANHLELIVAIGVAIILMNIFGIGCPILYLTGVPCMGCGMTRAFMALVRMDLVDAFLYHPLWWLVPVYLFVLSFREKISKRQLKIITVCVIALFVIIYVVRLINSTDQIVRIDIKNGLIYKIIKRVWMELSI